LGPHIPRRFLSAFVPPKRTAISQRFRETASIFRASDYTVYARLAPKVLEELKKTVPRNLQGRHRFHLHRRLTDDIGHPKLREHLASVVTLMRISDSYQQFENYLDKAHPRYNENMLLPFSVEDDSNGNGI